MEKRVRIGSRIQRLRRANQLSQEKLAELADFSTNYLSRIERGKENPSFEILVRIADVFDMAPYQLLQFEQDGEKPSQLRKRLEHLVKQVKDDDLIRAVRIMEALVY